MVLQKARVVVGLFSHFPLLNCVLNESSVFSSHLELRDSYRTVPWCMITHRCYPFKNCAMARIQWITGFKNFPHPPCRSFRPAHPAPTICLVTPILVNWAASVVVSTRICSRWRRLSSIDFGWRMSSKVTMDASTAWSGTRLERECCFLFVLLFFKLSFLVESRCCFHIHFFHILLSRRPLFDSHFFSSFPSTFFTLICWWLSVLIDLILTFWVWITYVVHSSISCCVVQFY